MALALGFWLALTVTVCLLALALWSGFTHRRRWHLLAGPLAIAMLGVTILLTVQLTARYTFPAEPMHRHLLIARVAGLLALPVVATGIWTWRRPAGRRWHRLAVLVFVVGALVATGTGLWVFGLAVPK